MNDLPGRIAFITGGAHGIGLGIARALARESVRLVLVDIDEDALAAAGAELDAAIRVLDVRDRDTFEHVVADVEETVGPIAILCNNAGVGGGASVTTMSYAMWDWVLGVNLGGVVNGIQTVVPRMVTREVGHVVNTSSGSGLVATEGTGFMYNASKFAVVGLSETLAQDLGRRGIGVTVLCPGPVATDIHDRTEALRPDKRELTPAQRKSFEQAKAWMRTQMPADVVGRLVVDGLRANSLYIHTDRTVAEAVRLRAERILASMPADG